MPMTPTAILMKIVLLLIFAQLLGDFVLQPAKWVREKARSGFHSKTFWYHILLHGLLSWLLIFDRQFWPWALAIMIIHGCIDQWKRFMQGRARSKPGSQQKKGQYFWIDQLLHISSLLIIALLWQTFAGQEDGGQAAPLTTIIAGFKAWWTTRHILLLTLLIFLTSPSAVIIRMLISGWTPSYNNQLETDSLRNAGTYIGMLERLFVFIFLIYGHIGSIGFLLAAKSIFRFGDLRAAKDRKLTEYVLIGTLLSFALALLAALIYLNGQLN